MLWISILLWKSLFVCVFALDNGLVRTPPMGFLSWERFRCITDCSTYPDDCISEKLFMEMADHFVTDGFKEAGYQYINIDDCWFDKQRDSNRRLKPDPLRFPNGMKALADYVHSKGLKFGIYMDIGTATCQGYPGSLYDMQLDAVTFAEWQVDYVKIDNCFIAAKEFNDGLPPMALFLNLTGRPMAVSCAYTLYQRDQGQKVDYIGQAKACNLGRICADITDTWDSLKSTIECYGNYPSIVSDVVGPGYFNDPDMLLIGNYGLSHDQERVQMAMWSVLAAPLLISTDLRKLRPSSKALLLNKLAISINQDVLGIQGLRVVKQNDVEVWTKPISPAGSYAVAILNLGTATPAHVSVQLSDIGLHNAGGYNITEVFDGIVLDPLKPSGRLSNNVNPSGVFFIKAVAITVSDD